MIPKFLSLSLFDKKPQPPAFNTILSGNRVMMRLGELGDWDQWKYLRGVSREFLIPWEPLWPQNALSRDFFTGLLRRQWRDWRLGASFSFFLFQIQPDGAEILLGGLSLNQVRYGRIPKGTLGYWMGKPFTGQGLMTEAVHMASLFARDRLYLERLEASCLPHNEASKKVLRKNGFIEESYAKAYLKINGRYEDHIIWAKPLSNNG